MRLILAVSLRRWRSLPKLFIQGLLLVLCSERNLSAKASEINALRGIPRSAATDLARRKMPSGISKVVFFIAPLSHIYGSMPCDCSMRVLQFSCCSSARGLMAKQKSGIRVTQSEFRKHYFGAF